MADKDDKDTSFGGSQGGKGTSSGSSSGGYSGGGSVGDARSDTPSSGRGGGGLGSAGGGVGGGTSSGGGGGGGSVGDARSDTPSSGRAGGGVGGGGGGGGGGSGSPTGGNPGYGWGGGHSAERGIDRSLSGTPTGSSPTGNINAARADTPSAGRAASTLGGGLPGNFNTDRFGPPTGIDPARLGGLPSGFNTDRFGTTTNPTGFNTARFGETIDPTSGVDPARFGQTTARVGNAPPTGYDPNAIGGTVRASLNANIDPARFGYDTTTGMVSPNIDPARFGYDTVAPTTNVADRLALTGVDPNIDPARFGPATPTASTGPIGLGTAAGMPAPVDARFGVTPTGYPAAGMPVGPAGPIQSATSPTGTVAAPTIMDAPTTRIDLATAPKADFHMVAGRAPPTTDIADRISAAWASVLGADNVRITGTSGKRATGGKGRHPAGKALDYSIEVKTPTGDWRSLNFGNKADLELMGRVAEVGARDFGIQGVGYGNGYMGNTHAHMDLNATPGPNQDFEWMAANDPKAKASLADARADYKNAGKAPARETPVAGMLEGAPAPGSDIAALNNMTGVGTPTRAGPTTTAATPAAAPAMAGATPTSVSTPGVGGFPSTPAAATGPTGFDMAITGSTSPYSISNPNPNYQRSLGRSALAGTVDVLTGPIGLGMGLATSLATGQFDTFGGFIADASGGKYGPNHYRQGAGQDREGGRSFEHDEPPSTISQTPTVKPGTTTTKPAESTLPYEKAFAAKYLDRPTPAEKWGITGKATNYV